VSRAARYSGALALAAVLAACGNSGHGTTTTFATVPPTAPATTALAPASSPAGRTMQELATRLGTGLQKFQHDFAVSGRSQPAGGRQAVLQKLSNEFGGADQAIAKAAADAPLGGQASGLNSLRGVTQPVATFLAASSKASTPDQLAKVYCNLRALDRLHRAVTAAERQVNAQAQQLGAPAAPLTVDRPSRGLWNVAMGAGCIGVLRDQFTALTAASKKKQAKKAAATADAIRASMLQVRTGLGPGRSADNPAAVRSAASSLRQLATLEATYMALVARSWRRGSVSQSHRKRLEKQIPPAFRRAAARIKASGALNF
jgi:hypothetical protein